VSGAAEILVVAAVVGGACGYLALRYWKRSQASGDSACGSQCGCAKPKGNRKG
jgi:hypothetical protein